MRCHCRAACNVGGRTFGDSALGHRPQHPQQCPQRVGMLALGMPANAMHIRALQRTAHRKFVRAPPYEQRHTTQRDTPLPHHCWCRSACLLTAVRPAAAVAPHVPCCSPRQHVPSRQINARSSRRCCWLRLGNRHDIIIVERHDGRRRRLGLLRGRRRGPRQVYVRLAALVRRRMPRHVLLRG